MIVDKLKNLIKELFPINSGDIAYSGMDSVYIKDDILYFWFTYTCDKSSELPQTIEQDLKNGLFEIMGKKPFFDQSITIEKTFYDDASAKSIEYIKAIKVMMKYNYDIERRVTRTSMRTLLGLK